MSITSILFLLGFFGGVLLALLRHPFWGLITYIAVYYLDPYGRWWSGGLPSLRWALISAVVTLIAIFLHANKRQTGWLKQGPIILVLIYTIWMWLQFGWAITGSDHTNGVEIFTKYLLVLFMIFALVDSRDKIETFLLAHTIGCFYLGYIAYTTYTSGRLDGVGGAGINDANSLGMQLGTGTICGIALFLSSKGWRKWLSAASIPFTMNAIIMTGSRGAFLALVCGGLGFLWLAPRRQLARLLPYLFGGIVLFGIVANDAFWERMATIGNVSEGTETMDHSASSRLEILKYQWQMVKDYPFGTGHKGTAYLSYSYMDDQYMSSQGGRSSHNSITSAMVDQGFIGLILWLWLMFALWRRSRQNKTLAQELNDVRLGWMVAATFGSLVTYWTQGLFAPLLKTEIYIWLIALVCVATHVNHDPAVRPMIRMPA